MTTDTSEEVRADPAPDPEVQAMLEAGVHLGHTRSKRHPAMGEFVWAVRNNVEIIDLTKTKEKLAEALAFLKAVAGENKLVLFVGTRPTARDLVAETASALGYPYVNQRWIGGTLTNFRAILKRIETLEGMEHEKASGGLEKYTKKERLVMELEMGRLRQNFDGLRRLRKLPDVMIIIDIAHDALALREAKRIKIPVVALTDTNTDPRLVAYPIPANDDARSAIHWMLQAIALALREGQEAARARAASLAAEAAAAEKPVNA